MEKKVIHVGADHAGFELKEHIKAYLIKKGHQVYDEGAYKLDKHDDYPDFAKKVAEEIADNPEAFGILCCGSAQGMCIAANKVHGVRAISATTQKEASLTRTHNNANVLCLAGWFISKQKAVKIVEAFLENHFSNHERHARRLKKIARIEENRD